MPARPTAHATRSLGVLATCLLATSWAPAQTITLPIGADGGQPFNSPFGQPSMRVQGVYSLLGTNARVFSRLGLRREGRLPNRLPPGNHQDPGESRSFDPLRIRLGRGDISAFGNNLTNNYTGSPTEVFRRRVSLPPAKDNPSHPMPWATEYDFPFQTTYTHLGTSDLIVDITTEGGSLGNGRPWTLTSLYFMDAWRLSNRSVAWANFYTRLACPTQLQIGGDISSGPSGVVSQAYLGAMNSPPNTGLIIGFGLQGVRQPGLGTRLASSCQPLMMQPLFTSSATTNAAGRFDIYLYQGPHVPTAVGVPIFAQAAYADPASSLLQLTNSAELRMPDVPDTTIRARAKFAVPATSSTALPSIVPDTAALSLRLR